MPIKSYLAIAKDGSKRDLQQVISKLPGCEVTPAENKNVLVIITETRSAAEDEQLLKKLKSLDQLQMLTLVSAFSNQSELTSG